jgi:hypothetical protein
VRAASVIVLLLSVDTAAQPSQYQSSIVSYQEALKSVTTRAPRALETALARLYIVRDALMGLKGWKEAPLAALTRAEFAKLERDLPGVLIGREVALFVEPDPEFFLKLAEQYGDAADRAFFTAYRETYPDSLWPSYIQQQTDEAGCTDFGGDLLVDAYRRWSDFSRNFPGRYEDRSREQLDLVGDRLQSTCACGDAASVEQELQQFVLTFPHASISGAIGDRLQAIRAGRSRIRFDCGS